MWFDDQTEKEFGGKFTDSLPDSLEPNTDLAVQVFLAGSAPSTFTVRIKWQDDSGEPRKWENTVSPDG